MKQWVLLFFLAFPLAGAAACAGSSQLNRPTSAIQQVMARERELSEALAALDTARMSRLFAAEFVQISANSGAPVRDRLQALVTVTEHDPARPIQSIESDSVLVRLFGSMAIVTGRTIIRMTDRRQSPARQTTVLNRFTHVWAHSNGGWQLVSNHISTISRM
jgi:ketosteroid isomerase-like protein